MITFLVVGAGPAGLATAALLGRRGHDVLVVEARDGPTPPDESRAITWMPEGLLAADELGITEQLRERAIRRTVHEFRSHATGRPILELDFAGLSHRHPYTLNLPQHHSEAALLEAALASGRVQIHRGLAVEALPPADDRVAVLARSDDGRQQVIEARYGIAADGAHSCRTGVGSLLGIAENHRDYGAETVVADVMLDDNPGDPTRSWIALDPRRPLGAFCFGERRWRLVYRLDPRETHQTGTSENMIEGMLRQAYPDARATRHLWASAFRLGQGQANTYGLGRWALVGDAAHAMGPSAGAGMMVGLLGAWQLETELRAAHPLDARTFVDAVRRYEVRQRQRSRAIQTANQRIFRNIASRSAVFGAVRNTAVRLLGHTPLPRRMTATEALAGLAPTTRG